jgi:hypothetical protein
VGTAHHRTAPSSRKVPSPCHPGLVFFPFGGRCPPYDGTSASHGGATVGMRGRRVGTAHHRTAPSSRKVPSSCHPGLVFFHLVGGAHRWPSASHGGATGCVAGWALPTTAPSASRRPAIRVFSIWWAVPTLRWHIGKPRWFFPFGGRCPPYDGTSASHVGATVGTRWAHDYQLRSDFDSVNKY